jgi:hypothetical protein
LVKEGVCMIYHYTSPEGTPYTIEFRQVGKQKVRIAQMYGKYNQAAKWEDREYIQRLLANYNESREGKENDKKQIKNHA